MATTVRIAVKGSEEQAREAMAARGVTGRYAGPGRTGGSTYWDVPESQRPALVSWHCEPSTCLVESGYPAGTLLFHG